MTMRIVTAGGDFSYRNAKRINDNFEELNGTDVALEARISANEDKLLGWEDLRFPASTLNPPGSVADADVDSSSIFLGTLLFDAGATEICAGQAQFPHAKKLDSIIYPHVHWAPTSTDAGNVLWRLEYIIADRDGVFPESYTVINTLAEASLIANMHLSTPLGTGIDTTGYGISTMMVWKLSRIGGDASDTYGADARLLEFDIHYQADEIGSAEERAK